jgi:hypothetical protein
MEKNKDRKQDAPIACTRLIKQDLQRNPNKVLSRSVIQPILKTCGIALGAFRNNALGHGGLPLKYKTHYLFNQSIEILCI